MIARFFSYLFNSVGVVLRTFRAFFMRQVMSLRANVRRVTSFSRQAAKAVPMAMSSVAVAAKKPTKREDFVETRRLFIAKSFLIYLVLGVLAVGLIGYFVVWPWMVSKFFTAHLYFEDSAVAAYNGKVILYYDPQKEEQMLQARLQEGLAQGAGQSYDEEGRITYTGNYVDGLYDGRGSLYNEGVLLYEGGFTAGIYEGQGKLYADGSPIYEGGFAGGKRSGEGSVYKNGVLEYKGAFADDVYNGQGVEYHADGRQVKYSGGFLQGAYAGEGTAYYENGQMRYKGMFENGLFEQEGTLYGEDGATIYEGGFHVGLYQGEGTLHTDNGWVIKGNFEAGAPAGDVEIDRDGKLYYRGQTENLLPHGAGTLYSADGKAIYTGNMVKGVADVGALLGKPAEEIRAAFAEAALVETPATKGFSIYNAALGVVLFCTYKSDASGPTAYYAYAFDKGADPFTDAMPWRNAADYEAAAEGYEKRVTQEKASFIASVPYPGGKYYRTAYYYKDYVFIGWSESEGGPWIMAEWIGSKSLPSAAATSATGSADRLSDVLIQTGLAAGTPAGAGPNEYYGAQDPTEAVKAAADKRALCKAMAAYYLAAETKTALEEQAAQKESQLQAAKKQLLMETVGQETVDELSSAFEKLQLSIKKADVDMEKARLAAAKAASGVELADYDVRKALFIADPAKLDLDALKASGSADAVELAYLDLTISYQELLQAQKAYEQAVAAAAAVKADYAMGKADDAALAEADAAKLNAAIALNSGLYACTEQMLALDELTGGYLSNQYGYFTA